MFDEHWPDDALAFTFALGLVNCFSVLISTFLVDTVGRRPLTIISTIGLVVTTLTQGLLT